MVKKGTARQSSRFIFASFSFMVFLLTCVYSTDISAQESESAVTQENALRVYLDGMRRYEEFLTLEIPYVNFVRDRKLAQVHVMLTTQRTGSGGTENTLTFTGLQEHLAVNDTLVYQSQQMDSEDTVRRGILNTLTIGLVRYVSRTPLIRNIIVNFREPEGQRLAPGEVVDKWDYWVFNINGSGRFNGQETRRNLTINGSISADRITNNWKMSFGLSGNEIEQKTKLSTGWYTSTSGGRTFSSLVVKSLGSHWSVGGFGSVRSSIFNNLKLSYEFAPAIEFDVFPYSQSTRRIFTILYRVGYEDTWYNEETIFFKTHERLFNEELSARYQVRERWGTIETSLEGSHYFHDFDKNRVEWRTTLNINLFEGVSLDLSGSVSRIYDQLSLPLGEVEDEEALLNRRQRATSYSYSTSIGIRYTFGSIYSNIVNPRFNTNRPGGMGGGGGGGYR